MKFGYTIIYVADVKKAIAFYEKAFNLKASFVHESGEYGELDTGATKLAFASEAMAKTNCGEFKKNIIGDLPSGFEVAFVTDDVKNAYQNACENGALSVQEPAQKPWGQTVAHVRDINGVLVEICSPLSG